MKEEEGKKKEGEGKEKGGRGRKRCSGKGREYIKRSWGSFNNVFALKTFPTTLKMRGKEEKRERGRKKRERGRKKMHEEGKRIF